MNNLLDALVEAGCDVVTLSGKLNDIDKQFPKVYEKDEFWIVESGEVVDTPWIDPLYYLVIATEIFYNDTLANIHFADDKLPFEFESNSIIEIAAFYYAWNGPAKKITQYFNSESSIMTEEFLFTKYEFILFEQLWFIQVNENMHIESFAKNPLKEK